MTYGLERVRVQISPTEPPELRAIGNVSWFPEQHGCDVFFIARKCKVGIQRKELKDLIASIENGLLSKQISQMGNLDYKVLIVEGEPRFTTEGTLMGKDYGATWTREQLWGILWTARLKGLWVQHTANLRETIRVIGLLEQWFKKERHLSLDRRPGPQSIWGTKPTDREYGVYVLQSLPGVGPELAGRIYDKFGLPFRWTIDADDLVAIQGIGIKKAEAMIAAIGEID